MPICCHTRNLNRSPVVQPASDGATGDRHTDNLGGIVLNSDGEQSTLRRQIVAMVLPDISTRRRDCGRCYADHGWHTQCEMPPRSGRVISHAAVNAFALA